MATKAKVTEFNSRYNFKKGKQIINTEPSKTKQSFKEESDINNIMKKFMERGVLPQMIQKDPKYGDYAQVGTYQESLNTVLKAQEQFDALPSHLRDRFLNEPAKFLEFTADKNNLEEMYKLGLAIKPEKPEPKAPVEPKA